MALHKAENRRGVVRARTKNGSAGIDVCTSFRLVLYATLVREGPYTRRVRHLSRLRTPLRVRFARACVARNTKRKSPYDDLRVHARSFCADMRVSVPHTHEHRCMHSGCSFIRTCKRVSNNAAHATNTGNIKSSFNIFTRASENDEVSCFLIMYPRAPEPRNSRLGAPLFLVEKLLAFSPSFYPCSLVPVSFRRARKTRDTPSSFSQLVAVSTSLLVLYPSATLSFPRSSGMSILRFPRSRRYARVHPAWSG